MNLNTLTNEQLATLAADIQTLQAERQSELEAIKAKPKRQVIATREALLDALKSGPVTRADIHNLNLASTNLSGATFVDCTIFHCNFSLARLDETTFEHCNFRANVWQFTSLEGATFANCNVVNFVLEYCNARRIALTDSRVMGPVRLRHIVFDDDGPLPRLADDNRERLHRLSQKGFLAAQRDERRRLAQQAKEAREEAQKAQKKAEFETKCNELSGLKTSDLLRLFREDSGSDDVLAAVLDKRLA